jgi:hypothetical protein
MKNKYKRIKYNSIIIAKSNPTANMNNKTPWDIKLQYIWCKQ